MTPCFLSSAEPELLPAHVTFSNLAITASSSTAGCSRVSQRSASASRQTGEVLSAWPMSGFGTARVGAAPSSVPGSAENLVDGHSNKTISRLEEDVHTGQRARASGA